MSPAAGAERTVQSTRRKTRKQHSVRKKPHRRAVTPRRLDRLEQVTKACQDQIAMASGATQTLGACLPMSLDCRDGTGQELPDGCGSPDGETGFPKPPLMTRRRCGQWG